MQRLLASYRLPSGDPPALAAAIASRTTPRPSASDRRDLGVPVAGAVENAEHGAASVSYRLPERLRADDVLTLAAWDLPRGVMLERIELPVECADRLPRAALGATGIRTRLALPAGRPLVFTAPGPWNAQSLTFLRDEPDLVRHLPESVEGPHSRADVAERANAIRDIFQAKDRRFLLLGDLGRFWAYEGPRLDFTDREAREAKLVEGAASMCDRGFDGIVVPLEAAGFDIAPAIADAIGGPVFFEQPHDDTLPWFVNESRSDRRGALQRFTRAVVFGTAARLAGADGMLFRPRATATSDQPSVLTRPEATEIVAAACAPLAGLPPLVVVLPASSPSDAAEIRGGGDHVALSAAPGIASPLSLRRACRS